VHEYLSLPLLAATFKKELKKYNFKYGDLHYHPYVDIFYSPVKWIFKKHLNAITSHIRIDSESEYENTSSSHLLEQILRGTPKMLSDRKILPKNESEVRNAVYENLIHVFPGTTRDIPIAKVSKTYKPDIGIIRLKCAIEYKFVDSLEQTKVAIGGIFEDIQGYAGSKDWTKFYAVIYMTDHFMTQDQIEEEFKLLNVAHHWKPLIVFGKGERIKKTSKVNTTSGDNNFSNTNQLPLKRKYTRRKM
jgi:hypothetical protein